jgi:hypothetical protein
VPERAWGFKSPLGHQERLLTCDFTRVGGLHASFMHQLTGQGSAKRLQGGARRGVVADDLARDAGRRVVGSLESRRPGATSLGSVAAPVMDECGCRPSRGVAPISSARQCIDTRCPALTIRTRVGLPVSGGPSVWSG